MKRIFRNFFITSVALGLFVVSGVFLWVATLEIPTLDGFAARQITQSTKIYDRTGEVLLFDLHEDIRRTVVPLEDMSRNLKNATIAIEDAEFYSHYGIRPGRTLKAVYDNITTGDLLGGQGGSTITQQVIKNTLLTRDKKISRKVKEWILALKIEQILEKDEILELYLNEAPYGGNIYGAEEASQHFYAKSASELTLVEAAYLAALPQAPSRYSPYGNRTDLLEDRKNLVLTQMLQGGFITQEEYDEASTEIVEFEQYGDTNIKAPHFVFYVREYLEEKYGREAVYESGLKVITTLNYDLQKIGEEVVAEFAYKNEEDFNAENAALVAIDPKTGHILTMVGSRNYFDEDIDGKFNITTAYRQPGSTFKPIVYASAFEQGYTPETVVFDVPTQFSTNCEPNNFSSADGCYSPVNYDGVFRGPMTFRNALAQSINIPAVKALYLVGVNTALETAQKLGIESLAENVNYYGLPLVLGGGEVSPLEITSAYGVFANDGVRHPHTAILRVEDSAGTVLEEYEENEGKQVILEQTARSVSSVLTDIQARTPAYGENSFSFGSQQVAIKTGTTNDFRDVWIMGYTPSIAVGTWGGNNDNSPIVKKVAGFVLAPMWRAYMDRALPLVEAENFEPPIPEEDVETLKPVLRGFWQGSTASTTSSVHSILHWASKNDPRGPVPSNPTQDPQYESWEYAVNVWAQENTPQLAGGFNSGISNQNINMQESIKILSPVTGGVYKEGEILSVLVGTNNSLPITSVDYYFNDVFLGNSNQKPYTLSIIPSGKGEQTITVTGRGGDALNYTTEVTFQVD
ncbi:penicillin-binding protein [Candidatus Kaiserbacteria bacterium]|nr:MAG: penicillin-binding protein [Candidatus Kaiserbacteria bacterium]